VYSTLPNGINALPIGALKVESGPKLVPNMHIFAGEAFTAIPEDGLPRHDGFP